MERFGKSALASKTVLSMLLMLVPFLLSAAAHVYPPLGNVTSAEVERVLTAGAEIVGAVGVVYGRMSASVPVTGLVTPANAAAAGVQGVAGLGLLGGFLSETTAIRMLLGLLPGFIKNPRSSKARRLRDDLAALRDGLEETVDAIDEANADDGSPGDNHGRPPSRT